MPPLRIPGAQLLHTQAPYTGSIHRPWELFNCWQLLCLPPSAGPCIIAPARPLSQSQESVPHCFCSSALMPHQSSCLQGAFRVIFVVTASVEFSFLFSSAHTRALVVLPAMALRPQCYGSATAACRCRVYTHAPSGTTQGLHPLIDYYRGAVFLDKVRDVRCDGQRRRV